MLRCCPAIARNKITGRIKLRIARRSREDCTRRIRAGAILRWARNRAPLPNGPMQWCAYFRSDFRGSSSRYLLLRSRTRSITICMLCTASGCFSHLHNVRDKCASIFAYTSASRVAAQRGVPRPNLRATHDRAGLTIIPSHYSFHRCDYWYAGIYATFSPSLSFYFYSGGV